MDKPHQDSMSRHTANLITNLLSLHPTERGQFGYVVDEEFSLVYNFNKSTYILAGLQAVYPYFIFTIDNLVFKYIRPLNKMLILKYK